MWVSSVYEGVGFWSDASLSSDLLLARFPSR